MDAIQYIESMISNVAFPIFVAGYLLIQNNRQRNQIQKLTRAYLKSLQELSGAIDDLRDWLTNYFYGGN